MAGGRKSKGERGGNDDSVLGSVTCHCRSQVEGKGPGGDAHIRVVAVPKNFL